MTLQEAPTLPPANAGLTCSLPLTGSDPLTGKSILAAACDSGEDWSEPTLGSSIYQEGFKKALVFSLEKLTKEPRSVLHIGGCRQQLMARYFAFLFPNCKVALIDPDAQHVERAREKFKCRFQFNHAPLEEMPFQSDHFDLVIAHNLFEYVQDWPKAMAEIGRVTKGQLVFSVPEQGFFWNLIGKRLPGVDEYLAESGVTLPVKVPDRYQVLSEVYKYGRIKNQVFPFPWRMMTAHMLDVREQKTVLAK